MDTYVCMYVCMYVSMYVCMYVSQIWVQMSVSTGCRLMAPLHSFQVCSPAEELQPSQGVCNAQRVRRKQKTVSWKLCTWNLRSMVDTMGSVEIASQGTDNHRGGGEESKLSCGCTEEV